MDSALRRNERHEALSLLSEALIEASPLRGRGANLMLHLLELRADVHSSVGDLSAAETDIEHASRLRALTTQRPTAPAA